MTDQDIRSALVAIEAEAAQTARTAHAIRVLFDLDPAQVAASKLHVKVQNLDVHSARLRDETAMIWLEIRRPWWRRWWPF